MTVRNDETIYQSPIIDVIEIEVEKGFAESDGPTITNPSMGWADAD